MIDNQLYKNKGCAEQKRGTFWAIWHDSAVSSSNFQCHNTTETEEKTEMVNVMWAKVALLPQLRSLSVQLQVTDATYPFAFLLIC